MSYDILSEIRYFLQGKNYDLLENWVVNGFVRYIVDEGNGVAFTISHKTI